MRNNQKTPLPLLTKGGSGAGGVAMRGGDGHLITYYKHQERFVKTFPSKRYLAWEVGTGKTIASLGVAKEKGFKNLLVIAPRSAHLSWQRENIYFNLNLKIITYEHFRDKLQPHELLTFDLIIFDESHRLSYTTTNWTKKALAVRPLMGEILMLSGTPADKYYKLYAQLKILTNGKDEMFKRFSSYTKFINYYYELDDYFKPKHLKRKEDEKELKEWFEKYADIVRREDVIELPPISYYTIKLKKGKLEYDISNYELANFIKEYVASSLSEGKFDYVLDFIEDNPDTVVFSYSKEFVKQISQKVRNKAYCFTGETSKQEVLKAIIRQDKPIITTYFLSEGVNLQRNYRNIIFASLPLKYIEYEQAIGRVYRSGQERKVICYILLQHGIDYTVWKILQQKKDVVEYLRNARNT